ncbi:hypothetical protein PHYPSEUDO_007580 [Phytophthora pseudosyringae]|uniref:Uncharacterized protein n=1 Tax=Phytophthora pseudosyringae TaxID=221518 RepID=A0A8T1VJ89_9STRA|nr:hypothetical protein PHYPSEUDO_007580 [Phytophthora pseudosyringae]
MTSVAAPGAWPPFSAAVLVTRECFPAAGGALPHVTRRISDFLDTLSRGGAFSASCRRGDSERELSYLHRRDPAPLSQQMVRHAAASGHAHVLKWIQEHEDPSAENLWKDCNFSPVDEAAKNGHLNNVRRPDEMHWIGWAFTAAADHGRVEVAKWVKAAYPEALNDSSITLALSSAMDNGHDDMVQWLRSQQSERR